MLLVLNTKDLKKTNRSKKHIGTTTPHQTSYHWTHSILARIAFIMILLLDTGGYFSWNSSDYCGRLISCNKSSGTNLTLNSNNKRFCWSDPPTSPQSHLEKGSPIYISIWCIAKIRESSLFISVLHLSFGMYGTKVATAWIFCGQHFEVGP